MLLQGITDALSRQGESGFVLGTCAELLSGCPNVVYGTLNKDFRHESAGKWGWDDASAVVAAIEAAGSWDRRPEPKPNPFPHESRIDVASHKRRKRFSTSFMSSHVLLGQWCAILARPLRSRERGGLPEPD